MSASAKKQTNRPVLVRARGWFTDDDDDEIWTWESYALSQALAPFAGLFMVGQGINWGLSKWLKQPAYDRSENPIKQLMQTGWDAATHIEDAWNTDDPEAMLKEWNRMATVVAVNPSTAAMAALANLGKTGYGAYKNLRKEED